MDCCLREKDYKYASLFEKTTCLSVAVILTAVVFSSMRVCVAADPCAMTTPLTGGTTYTANGTGNVAGGYHYSLWHDGGGTMKMTVYGVGAAFNASWNNAGDFLARVGLKWDETKTSDQYGNVMADYAFKKTGTGGGYSYIGIYGWSNNPLIEYYITDNWFGSAPPNPGSLQGSFDIDGGTYKIFKSQRVNKPSIHGTATFWQFFSIRQTARQCGHISISGHWKKWAGLGMNLGKMYEAKILVEAGGGAGTFDLTYATVQANVPTSALPSPEIKREIGAYPGNGKSGVVSLVALNGTVLRSVRQDESGPAIVPMDNLPGGLYLLRFQGEGGGPETRKFLIDRQRCRLTSTVGISLP